MGEGGVDGFGPGYHHNVPAGPELRFVDAVDLPQSSADPVSYMGLAQLLAHGDAHPIGVRPVFPGVKHQIAAGEALGVVQPLEYVIEL